MRVHLFCGIYFSVSPSVMAVVRFYSDEVVNGRALQRAAKLYPQLSITTELCYNVELTGERLTARHFLMTQISLLFYAFCLSAAGCESLGADQKEVLLWLFRPPLQTEPLSETPKLSEGSGERLVEIGPRYHDTDLLCHNPELCPGPPVGLSSLGSV